MKRCGLVMAVVATLVWGGAHASAQSPRGGDLSPHDIQGAGHTSPHNRPLPAATRLGPAGRMPPTEVISDDSNGNVEESPFDPENDGIDFYESLEGMRVVIHDGDFNPERILIDYREEFPPYIKNGTPRVAVGDVFRTPIVGVVGYSYGNYKVLPLDRLPPVTPGGLERESVAPVTGPSLLSVAAFNVYNLGGENEPGHFVDIAETIVDGLASPDIVALSEVQDSDGA